MHELGTAMCGVMGVLPFGDVTSSLLDDARGMPTPKTRDRVLNINTLVIRAAVLPGSLCPEHRDTVDAWEGFPDKHP